MAELQQGKTGNITEQWVKDKIIELGLDAQKPVPDVGVDLVVTSPEKPDKELKIQIKGRGKVQRNKRYRWFQIRTTPKQREEATKAGFPLNEAWRKKVALVDLFIFVSEKNSEFWIFESNDIEDLIRINSLKYGHRPDNKDGHQFEIDLDIKHKGKSLTEIYNKNLNNWDVITNHFN